MNTRIFSIVVDGTVLATISVPETATNHDMLWAGLSSSPQVIESTSNPDVAMGWNYDGESFSRP